MKITLTQIRALEACEEQAALFEERFGEEAEVTLANCIKAIGLDFDFASLQFLTRSQRAAYREATAPALAAYEEAKAAAWDAYEKATAPALAARQTAKAPARVAYQEATAPAWAAHQAAIAAAWAAYWAATATALADQRLRRHRRKCQWPHDLECRQGLGRQSRPDKGCT